MRQERLPRFGESLAVLIVCILVLVGGILLFDMDTAVALLFATIVLSLFGIKNGIPYKEIQASMIKSLGRTSQVLVILILVGALVGAMMAAGTIPYIIDIGLKSIRPIIFLPLVVFFCSILSFCTGSSISVMFTLGVAFLGIAKGIGVPQPITAGAVLCGAYFGDKQSPLSSFVAFSSSLCRVDLFKHIKNELYTTIPATLGSMIIFFVMGLKYSGADSTGGLAESISIGLNDAFNLSAVTLVPLAVLMGLILLKVPALPAIAFGAISASIVAVIYQGIPLSDAMSIMVHGYRTTSTMEFVVTMANRGGMLSMAGTIITIALALCMGGAMMRVKLMDVVMSRFASLFSKPRSLVIATVFTAFFGHYLMAQVMPAALLTANAFSKKYEDLGVDKCVLSRSISDGALLSCPIVPWDPDGVCAMQAFGLATIAFAPYYFFIWITLLAACVCAITGFGIKHYDYALDPEKQRLS